MVAGQKIFQGLLMIAAVVVHLPAAARTHAQEMESAANAANLAGNHEEALRYTNQGLKLDSRNPYLYYERSIAYQMLNKPDLALKDADRAVTFRPTDARLYQRKGDVLQAMGKIELAIEQYTRSIAQEVGFGTCFRKRAHCYDLLGEKELAKKDWQSYREARKAYDERQKSLSDKRYLAVIAETLSPHGRRSLDELKKRSPREANYLLSGIAIATRQIKRDPKNRRAFFVRAHYLEELKDYESAYKDMNRVLAIDPAEKGVTPVGMAMDEMQFRHARVARKLGRWSEALADYGKILQLEPDCEEAYRYRGECYVEQGKLMPAIEDFTKAIELDRESAGSTYLARAAVLDKLGKSEEAKRDRAQARKLGYVQKEPGKK